MPVEQRLTAVEVQPHELYIVLAPRSAEPLIEADDVWAPVWQRVGSDTGYRERLLREPVAALAEHGIAPPPGVILRAVEDDDAQGYLFVPPKPVRLDDDEQAADDVAGYFSCCGAPPPRFCFSGLPPGSFGTGYPSTPPPPPPPVYVTMPSRSFASWPPR